MNNNTIKIKDNMNESVELALLSFPLIATFIINYVLGTLQFIILNYVIPNLSNNYVKSNKWSNTIKKISNYDVEVYIVKTKIKNAWNIGTKKLFITSALINMLTPEEITAILLHECGHYANYDVQKNIYAVTPLSQLLTAYLILPLMFIPGGIAISIIIRIIMASTIEKLIQKHLHGRKAEFLADSFASEYGYGKYLISGLNKLSIEFKKEYCRDKTQTECKFAMDQIYFYDEHPQLFERKINIKSKNLKYTNKFLETSKNQSDKKLIRKSYFEIRNAMIELKNEIKEYKNKIQKTR